MEKPTRKVRFPKTVASINERATSMLLFLHRIYNESVKDKDGYVTLKGLVAKLNEQFGFRIDLVFKAATELKLIHHDPVRSKAARATVFKWTGSEGSYHHDTATVDGNTLRMKMAMLNGPKDKKPTPIIEEPIEQKPVASKTEKAPGVITYDKGKFKRLLEMLPQGKDFGIDKLKQQMKILKLSRSSMSNYLRAAVEQGYVTKVSLRVYHTTDRLKPLATKFMEEQAIETTDKITKQIEILGTYARIALLKGHKVALRLPDDGITIIFDPKD